MGLKIIYNLKFVNSKEKEREEGAGATLVYSDLIVALRYLGEVLRTGCQIQCDSVVCVNKGKRPRICCLSLTRSLVEHN